MTISTKMAMIGTIPSRLCAKNQQLCKESLICMCIEKLKIFPSNSSLTYICIKELDIYLKGLTEQHRNNLTKTRKMVIIGS